MNTLPILTSVLQDATTASGGYGGTAGPDLTQYGSLLLSLLVTIGFLAWAFKRLVGGTLRRKAEQRTMQICDALPLGNKQRACVIRCYDRSFLIGVTDRHVELIAELDAAAIGGQAPKLDSAAPLGVEHKDAFLRALQRVAKEKPATTAAAAQRTPTVPAKSKVLTPAAPAKESRTRKPAAATRLAEKRTASQPARKRLDDGRGMLA